MKKLLLEILNHPTDMLAILDPEKLEIKACNKNLAVYFAIQENECLGKVIFELAGKSVPQEKLNFITRQIKERQFYLDYEFMDDYQMFFNSAKCDEENCVVVRVSSVKYQYAIEQYRHLFNRNLAGIYRATLEGKIISCNPAFAHIMGYLNEEELVGMNTIKLYKNPTERKSFLQLLRTKSEVSNYEIEIIRKDGSLASCLENAYLENMPDGRELLSGIVIDISEKKRIEQELLESEARFRTIANVSGESVVFCKGDVIVDCNDQFAKLFGYQKNVEVLGQKLTTFFSPPDIKRIYTTIDISDENQVELRTFDRDGKTIFIELKGSHIVYKAEQTHVLVINDITSRKKAEHVIEQSVVRLRNLLENSPNGIVILTDEKIRYVNHSACVLLDVEDEDAVFDSNFLQFVSSMYKREMKDDIGRIRNGEEVEYKEIVLISSSGREIDVGIKNTLTVYENKPSIQVTLNNISDRKQLVQEQVRIRLIEEINTVLKKEIEEHKITQLKLEEQQRETLEQKARLESIINSTENLMMWTVDSKFRITMMNRNFTSWMHDFYDEKVAVGQDIMKVLKKHVHPDFYQGQLMAFDNAFKGRPQQVEFPLKSNKGETLWLQAFLNPVYLGEKLEQISCLVYDNTERRQIERMVRDSLKEKEVLLQEVHHRVKNNLQIISSILSLQSGYVTDEGTLSILQESRERIKSMSFIHETLYRTSDFSKLEFTPYLKTIISNLVQSYRTPGLEVIFVPDLHDVYLSLDQSIPCGLIVNELVSNAMKYAWKGKKKGKLSVKLHENEPGLLKLVISDDGIGLPKTFSYEKTDSLGIQLVYTLLEQLDAKVEVKTSSKGTSFNIEFRRV
ncbi:MAG: PAS domain S-box protein [Flavobacteriales bacterium]